MMLLGEKYIPKLGRLAMNIGIVIMILGLIVTSFMFYHYTFDVHSWQLIPGLLLVGIGMGFVFGSLFAAVLTGVDPRHAGSASGIFNAIQQVGGSIGIAVVGVIFFGQLGHGATSSFNQITPTFQNQLITKGIPASESSLIIKETKQCFVDQSAEKNTSANSSSCETGSSSSPLEKEITRFAIQDIKIANSRNFAKAFRWAAIYEILILVVTFFLAFTIPKNFRLDPNKKVKS